MPCNACQLMWINGIKAHELGCPEAFKDQTRECLWCGSEFTPEHIHQSCCDFSCYASFAGLPNEEAEDKELEHLTEQRRRG